MFARKIKQSLCTLGVLALTSTSLVAQDAGHQGNHDGGDMAYYGRDVETVSEKFIELAEAMPADKYSWRPMEGVRTVSEVFMLIVAENYAVPEAWGVNRPEGLPEGNAIWSAMSAVTDKAEVLEHLRKSSEFFHHAVSGLDGETLHRNIQFFGQERSVNEAVFVILGDMHEHLGQAIAYARMNQVVPPWTARRNQNQ